MTSAPARISPAGWASGDGRLIAWTVARRWTGWFSHSSTAGAAFAAPASAANACGEAGTNDVAAAIQIAKTQEDGMSSRLGRRRAGRGLCHPPPKSLAPIPQRLFMRGKLRSITELYVDFIKPHFRLNRNRKAKIN
ncbi:MAG TPA: hypothetical protein VNV18_02065 [Stellaceae bacterium]|nr:hypothetical protein [Stellaceae bacterium]